MLANPIINRLINPIQNPVPGADALLSAGGQLHFSRTMGECLYLARLNATSNDDYQQGVANCQARFPGE
jgi:hypothetical protein